MQRRVRAFKHLHSKCTERLICCRYPALISALTAERPGNSRQSIQSDPGQFAQQPHASPPFHRIFHVGRRLFLTSLRLQRNARKGCSWGNVASTQCSTILGIFSNAHAFGVLRGNYGYSVLVRVTTDSICTKYPGRQVDISFLYFQLQAVRSLLGCLALLLGHDPSVPVCSYCIIHLWIWVELGWPGTTD